jgi:hypothetical protein
MKHIMLFVLFYMNITSAQESVKAYEIPFASKGNLIELSVANNSTLTAEGVNVEAVNMPEGVKFTNKSVTITSIKAKGEETASFTFSVDKPAQVNKEQTLSFKITDITGQAWIKDIRITIKPPMTFELLQNYPNPFNPTTTIEYQLPGTGEHFSVSLKIYDVIGREVITLVNEQQEPGYYQKTFEASKLSSGVYVYQLIAADEQNNKHTFKKKMVLLK